MSKLIPVLFAGAGTATVSVGGFYLVKNNSLEPTQKTKVPESEPNTKELNPSNVEEFQSGQGDECSKSLFGNVDFGKGLPSSQFDSSNPSGSDFFGTPSDAENKSCLVVNWRKKTKNEENKNKGSGVLTGSGSFINDKKGFITFNVVKTASSNKLHLTGVAYLLSKEGDEGSETGQIKHYKEIKDANKKEVGSTDFDKYIPQAKGDSTVFKVGDKVYWGWVDDGKNPGEMLDEESSDLSGQNLEFPPKSLSGEFKKGTTGKLTDWGKDFSGGDHLYTKTDFDLEQNLSSFQGSGGTKTS